MERRDLAFSIRDSAARLLPGAVLILPGCTFVGAGVGHLMGDPGPWTTVGLGLGASLWGLLLSIAPGRGR